MCKPKEVQDLVLVSPMGMSKLMDLLAENREVIRNDGVLLLIHLTKANANIQKIVAFENAFDKLLNIINEEVRIVLNCGVGQLEFVIFLRDILMEGL